jgi:uncharacterized protein
MESEKQTLGNSVPAASDPGSPLAVESAPPPPGAEPDPGLRWIFFGPEGLRAGWSAVIAFLLFLFFDSALSAALLRAHLIGKRAQSPLEAMFLGELAAVLSLLGAIAVVSLLEHRRILDYNLTGPRRLPHFLGGLVAGFLALSALIGELAAGGWLRFGPVALSGSAVLRYAAIWGCIFLLVGCFEEGSFRCYLQYTLTRGINFWWALALVAAICADLAITTRGNGAWGVYVTAMLGLIPCYVLHQRSAPRSGAFWQAAWVTSTFFGFVHTGNNGENWIGIFQAALIGIVLCVSIRVTGSAWWAIGCHAAWDWAETFFYGAADSGQPANGHFLTTSPLGNKLWSGGVDGPEGSILGLPVMVLLLLALLLIYGRKNVAASAAPPAPA